MHVTHNMDFGGTEQVIRQIVTACDNSQFESSVVCVDGRVGEIGLSLQANGVTVTSISRGSGLDRLAIAALRKLIRDSKIDVLHCHQYTPFSYGAIAAFRLGVKVIYTEHGRFHPDRYTWKRRAVNQVLSRLAHEITCISKATRVALDYYEWISKEKVRVIYNGVASLNDVAIDESVRTRLGIPESAFVLGTISRLDPIKNQTMMLEALSRVRKTHPECVLIMAGDGPERDALETTAATLGIQNSVFFTGFVTDIAAHLDAIDVFLLTSFSEGTSMTLLEAMSIGKVVVATAVGGNVEVIEDGQSGVLVPSGDVGALVESLLELRNDVSVMQELGGNAVKRFSEHFSVGIMVDHYERLYRREQSER